MAMSMADKLKAKEGKMVDRTTISSEPIKAAVEKKEELIPEKAVEKAADQETEKVEEVAKATAEEQKTEEAPKKKRASAEKNKQTENRNKKLGLAGIYLTVPLAAKEKIDIASKANGGLKEYVSKLILEDLKQNYDEYKKLVDEQTNNPWNF